MEGFGVGWEGLATLRHPIHPMRQDFYGYWLVFLQLPIYFCIPGVSSQSRGWGGCSSGRYGLLMICSVSIHQFLAGL